MNIGSLYAVKKWFWFLFPTKETATTAAALRNNITIAYADEHASTYLSRQYNCEVTYFCPDSIVVFLENDGKLKKVLTSEGKIGWTWFTEEYNDCFEELNKHLIG